MSPDPIAIRNERAAALQGRRAGIVTRVTADAIDGLTVSMVYLGILLAIAVTEYLVLSEPFEFPRPDLRVTVGVQGVLLVAYLAFGWGGTGRTIGKALMGLRVVRSDGSPLSAPRAMARAVVCVIFWWVLAWVVVSRRNLGLHDLLLRTAVVYDWSTD